MSDHAAQNKKIMMRLVGVMLVMGSLAWAAVPAYNLFCRVTGWGGATDVADAAPGAIEEMVTVRFDASKASGMPWEFTPVQTSMEIKIGEEGLAFYEAYNPTNRPIAGTASFNVAPYAAGAFFSKIDFNHWNLQQDAGRTWAEGVADGARQFPEHADLIARYDSHWHKSVPGPIWHRRSAAYVERPECAAVCDYELLDREMGGMPNPLPVPG